MAGKRMFRLDVIDTDAFLEMPCSTQALYFHLNLRADDDGFIGNPKKILRMIGAQEDDLKVLIAKNFVIQFDDGVIVIKHWRMHNTLSSSRYHETKYLEHKDCLLIKQNNAYSLAEGEIIDDTRLIEMSKRQVEKKVDASKTNNRRTIDEQKTNAEEEVEVDIDINKRISNDILRPTSEVERVVSEWNNLPEPIKKVKGLKPNTDRYKMLFARIKEYGIDDVLSAVRMVGESDFLRRGSDNGWTVDFGWFVRPNNFPKVLEGKYANKGNPAQNYRTIPKEKWDSYMWNDAIKDGYATNEEYREWRTKNVTL